MVRLIFICLSLSLFLCFNITAYAKDFGKYGVTTEIKEEGFLAMIERKLKNIDMNKEQVKMKNQVQERINEPIPVTGIVRTTKARSFIYDPTYILEEDIKLPCGTLLYPKGTKVNPLKHMTLARQIFFVDTRDESQEKWLKEQLERFRKSINMNSEQIHNKTEEEFVIILIGGRPLELQDKLNIAVYFDQGGILTSKFGIRQVPAIVMQERDVLRITEAHIGFEDDE